MLTEGIAQRPGLPRFPFSSSSSGTPEPEVAVQICSSAHELLPLSGFRTDGGTVKTSKGTSKALALFRSQLLEVPIHTSSGLDLKSTQSPSQHDADLSRAFQTQGGNSGDVRCEMIEVASTAANSKATHASFERTRSNEYLFFFSCINNVCCR